MPGDSEGSDQPKSQQMPVRATSSLGSVRRTNSAKRDLHQDGSRSDAIHEKLHLAPRSEAIEPLKFVTCVEDYWERLAMLSLEERMAKLERQEALSLSALQERVSQLEEEPSPASLVALRERVARLEEEPSLASMAALRERVSRLEEEPSLASLEALRERVAR